MHTVRTTVAFLAVMGVAHAAPTTSFTVSGNVAAPGTFTASSLAALPQTTQTETYRAGGTAVTDSFTGPTLSSVLQAAGGIVVDPAIKNDILRQYVVATGSDGYEAVISAGELAAKFGNKADQVATSDSAGQLPSPSGFARIVAAGDVAGGRYVASLASLVVGVAPAQPGIGGGVTSQLLVQGAVSAPLTETLATLNALPQHTGSVSYQAGATTVIDTYTGPLLWDVLNAAGIVTDATIKNDVLRKLVTVTGSDGYQADLSLGEIDPAFGNEAVLLATSDTGGLVAGGDGFAQLVVPGDVAGGRYVDNVTSLTVFDPTVVPEPASLAVMIMAVTGLACLRRRVNPSGAGRATCP